MFRKISELKEKIFGKTSQINDIVGYEVLIDYIDRTKLYKKEGSFLEIGAFKGGGSAKLAHYAGKFNKNLIVIDLFDPDFDRTQNSKGESMDWVYRKLLERKSLREVFDENTKNEKNIIVYAGDSAKIVLPGNLKLCFSFIDGNHNPEYIRNDFRLTWNKTVPGGAVAFHDYGGDLPQVTRAIDGIIGVNRAKIGKIDKETEKCVIFLRKK
jgi:hypothetical protein